LATDDLLWEREGQRALAYFEAKHSIPQVVERYVQMFKQLRSARS
jgi:hypothetical protein